MKIFKSNYRRSCLLLGIMGILLVSFVVVPLSMLIQPVGAQLIDTITRKWRSTYLPLGAYEGGFVIGDINHTNPGEEVIYAGRFYVYALDGRYGTTLWTYYDTAIGGYAKPNMYDLDNDGDLEILVPQYWPPGLLILNNDGSLRQKITFQYDGSIMASPVVGGNVEGDEHLEIFAAMQDVEEPYTYNGRIYKLIYDETEGEYVVDAESFFFRNCGGGISLADADNDGEFELYAGDRDAYVLRDGGYGKGVRSFWASNLTQRWNHPDVLCSSQCPVLADVDKDGVLDVIVSDQRGGLAVLDSRTGSPIVKARSIRLPGPEPNNGYPGHQQLTVYDIDGDGNLEVLSVDGVHGPTTERNTWPDNEIVILDLYEWMVTGNATAAIDARIGPIGDHRWDNEWTNQTGQFAPTLADVTGDGQMDIIVFEDYGMQVFNYTGQTDPESGLQIYDLIYQDTGSGSGPGGSWAGVKYSRYAIVQDIDEDGLVEVVAVSTSHRIYAWETYAPAPAERTRSEVHWYSEYRRGVAEYVPSAWDERAWEAPAVAPVYPGDDAVAVPVSLAQLTFKLMDRQGESMDYTVTSSPDIIDGSGMGVDVEDGTHSVSVTVPPDAYDTTYAWTVSATDGTHWTNRTYHFRTEFEHVTNDPPLHGIPLLFSQDGTDMTSSTFECQNQSTSDPDGDDVTNIYNWYVDGESTTNLLLSFDTRNQLTTKDYSPYGNDGIIHGATWTPDGVVGGAYYFGGDFDYITVSDGDIGDIHQPGNRENKGYFNGYPFPGTLGGSGTWTEITVELWVYLQEDQSDVKLVSKVPSYDIAISPNIGGFGGGGAAGDNTLVASVWTQNGTDYTADGYFGRSSVTYSTPLSSNTWYHVVLTYKDGVGLTLYVNGQSVASRSREGNIHCSSGEPLCIGSFGYFHGMIDEVRLYPRSLSEQQILNRYLESKDGFSNSSLFIPVGYSTGLAGATLECEVTPNDSFQDGDLERSEHITLINTPPAASNLHNRARTRGHLALEEEDLLGSYEYYDADYDPEDGTEIRWYQNGAWQPAFDDLLRVPAGSTTAGDEWNFTVKPKDVWGTFGDLNTSYTITIFENNLPTHDAPQLVSSAGTGLEDEDLIASNQSTADLDGDDVTNIYHWYVDGESTTNLLMPFDTEMPFDIEGFTTTKDYSGNGNDGNVSGAVWTEDGVVGGAYEFDGDDHIRIEENANSLGGDGTWPEISIEFWVKATTNTGTERLILKHDINYSLGGGWGEFVFPPYGLGYRIDFRARSTSTQLTWYVYTPSGYNSTAYSISEGARDWHHVVCTYKSGVGLKLYVDGAEKSSTLAVPSGNINATLDGLLDIAYGSGSGDFSGILDEVRIYPHALTPAQIFQRFIETKDGLSNSSTIVAQETTVDDVWSCEVIPNDSWQDGDAETSNTLTVFPAGPNSRPRIDWYSPVDATPEVNEGESLDFNHTSSDPDEGDTLTYSWLLDGVEQADTQNWTYSPGLAGIYNVTLVVYDGEFFDSQEWSVTVVATGVQYELTIEVVGNGATVPAAGSHMYDAGAEVDLTANADPGWVFSEWSGDLTGSENPTTILMDENKTVTATFIMEEYTLTVNVIGDGTVDLNATGPYYYGDVVELTANPDLGWSFSGWSEDLSGSTNPETIVMDGDKTVNATFTEDEYTLTVNVVGSGSVTLDPDQSTYTYGTEVDLTAVAADGWTFSAWSGDLTGDVNPETLTMDADKTVTATFTEDEYTLTVNIVGNGDVTRDPDQATYTYGTEVDLTAVAADGWTFSAWSGDLTGDVNPETLTMDADKTVTATFIMEEYTLTVNIIGDGIVDLNVTGPYHYGDVVELTANPDPNWNFYEWTGDLAGSANPTTIVMDENKTVNATFVEEAYTLTVNVEGSGSVGLNNTGPYYYGDFVELTANADAGWSFSEWSVDLSGSENPETIVMDGDKIVNATFIQEEYTLTINVVGSGSVSLNNTGPYYYGDVVELTANADPGWVFSHWSEDLAGSANPETITMDANKVVNATFVMEEYPLAVNIVGNGTVDLNATGPYYYGDVVELTANPDLGWSFSGWSVDLSGSINPETIVVDGDKTVNATFIEVPSASNGYLVVRGADDKIYYRLYNSTTSSWGSWKRLSGATSDSPTATVCQNELHIVVRGMDGSSLWHGYVNLADNTFIGWTRLSGSTPSAPTLTSNGTVLCLVVRGGDNRIYYCTYSFSPRGWAGWNVLPSGSTCDGPAAAMLGSDLHIVVRGFSATNVYGNYSMWHVIVEPNVGVVRGWISISGYTPSKPTLAVNQTANRLYLVVRGLDNRIYWRTYDGLPTDFWGSWNLVATGSTIDGPGATVLNDQLHIVVRGMDGVSLWHRTIDLSSGTPSPDWTKLTGSTPSAPTLTA